MKIAVAYNRQRACYRAGAHRQEVQLQHCFAGQKADANGGAENGAGRGWIFSTSRGSGRYPRPCPRKHPHRLADYISKLGGSLAASGIGIIEATVTVTVNVSD